MIMNCKIFDCPLGVCVNEYSPRKKEFIGAAIGAAVSIGSQIIGGIKASKERRKAEREQRNKIASEQAWYARRYNENYADTAAGQRLLTQAREYADNNWKKAQGAAKIGGDSDASVAMAKDAGNKVVADTLGNMAASDVQRKDNIDNTHMQNQQKFSDQTRAMHEQHASEIASVASAMGDAAQRVGSAYDSYSDAKLGSGIKTEGSKTEGSLKAVTGGDVLPDDGADVENPYGLEYAEDYA